jgi:hypothetical protein
MDKRDGESEATFVAKAEAYVALIDRLPVALSLGVVERVAGSLAGLYEAALQLATVSPTSSEPVKRITDNESMRVLRARVHDLFGAHTVYWLVFDPYDEEADREPVIGDLVDDLVSIYEDLHAGLEAYRGGGDLARDAVWDWDFGFRTHWGTHLTGALRALHSLISNYRV